MARCVSGGGVGVASAPARRRRARVAASASAQYGAVVGGRRAERLEAARREVLELTDKWMADNGRDRLSPMATSPALARAVETLVESSASRVDARETMARDGGAAWAGTWEVMHAPHLVKLSKLIAFWTGGTQVDHVRYVIGMPSSGSGDVAIESSVFYTNAPVGPGTGWAVASGTVAPLPMGAGDGKKTDGADPAVAASSTLVTFDHFAMRDGEDVSEKSPLEAMTLDAVAWRAQSAVDAERASWVSKVGTAFFLQSLAVFPTRYLDDDICVFEFPPLGNVQIACRRLTPPSARDVDQDQAQQDVRVPAALI